MWLLERVAAVRQQMEDHPAGKCQMADGGRQRLWRKLVLSEWEISAMRSCEAC